ncbi:MAG: alpha/beta hydrolase [Acetobacteraceae bacterium]|nr:alpha/beta hydrolase [Acetobacteraceae bacterium]
MLSQEEHELHYNPQRAVPNFAEYRAQREPDNARARATLRRHENVAYGEHKLHRLDIYPAEGGAPAPVHMFFHGGYWRAQDKENFAFIAAPLVARGITAVVANYELCPDSTLDAVAQSALQAVAFVRHSIGGYAGDPTRASLSGHSAGAHLVAEVLAADWEEPAFLRGAVMVSGIYDPAPAQRTTVNAELNLTPEIVARRNVEARPPKLRCPAWLFAGGLEPWRWIEQTFRYSSHLRRHGLDPEVHVLPGYNHFDIVSQFGEPESPIGRAMLAAAGL